MSELEALAAELQHTDPLRFGASLAAPPAARGRLWTLYALHHELARIPFSVSEPMLGEIRLQWWADQLAALGAGRKATGHPTLEALAREWGTEAGRLAALPEGHGRWCSGGPFATVAEALAMIDATSGALMQAAAGVLAPGPAVAEVAGLQGRGMGVAALLRGWPALVEGGWLQAPDLGPGLVQAGRAAFAEARSRRREVPKAAAPAFYAGAGLPALLDAAERDPAALPSLSEFRHRAGLARLALTGRWWV